jgi:hypothetical protein
LQVVVAQMLLAELLAVLAEAVEVTAVVVVLVQYQL